MSGEEKKIFISYYSKEQEIAYKIRKAFNEEYAEQIFIGESSLTSGMTWFKEIRNGLSKCELLVAVCSPNSVNRPWVAFECGWVRQAGIKIIVFCHSGMTKEKLPDYLNDENIEVFDMVKSKEAFRNLVIKIGEKLIPINGINKIINNLDTHKEGLKNLLFVAPPTLKLTHDAKKEESNKTEKYLWGVLQRSDNGEIKLSVDENRPPEELQAPIQDKNEEEKRIDRLIDMQDFLTGKINKVETGVAIGIQNCLYNFKKKELFTGIRYKSEFDSTGSDMTLTRGEFNTGYALMRKHKTHRKHLRSIENLQDLFVSQKTKYLVTPVCFDPNTGSELDYERDIITHEVYRAIDSRLRVFGSRLFRIRLLSNSRGDYEYGYASLLINNSNWFPRYEIGIWKYMDISDYETRTKKWQHFLKGFGEDVYQDYRGNVKVEESADQINFWVWVKDGKTHYRSYPEERFIPRLRAQRHTFFGAHSVLVSSDDLEKQYGVNDKYTSFIPDEKLTSINHKNIIQTHSALPAVRILTWF